MATPQIIWVAIFVSILLASIIIAFYILYKQHKSDKAYVRKLLVEYKEQLELDDTYSERTKQLMFDSFRRSVNKAFKTNE